MATGADRKWQASIYNELLTGAEKAATMALTAGRVRDLMQRLEDDEVERIRPVARFDTVPSSTLDKVLLEFQEAIGKHEISIQGGASRQWP